jgi:hypothetical protein
MPASLHHRSSPAHQLTARVQGLVTCFSFSWALACHAMAALCQLAASAAAAATRSSTARCLRELPPTQT